MSLTDWFDSWKTSYIKERTMQSGDAGERRGGLTDAQPETVSIHLYNALNVAHRQVEHVLSLHGCPQGADMRDWLSHQLAELHAARLALEVWEDYNSDLEALLAEHGWQTGELKLPWLRTRLHASAPRLAAPAVAASPEPTPVPAAFWTPSFPSVDTPMLRGAEAAADDSAKVSAAGGTFDGAGASSDYGGGGDSGGCDSGGSCGGGD